MGMRYSKERLSGITRLDKPIAGSMSRLLSSMVKRTLSFLRTLFHEVPISFRDQNIKLSKWFLNKTYAARVTHQGLAIF